MSAGDIDAYLASVPEDQRNCLSDLRARIRLTLPDCEETISYAMPAHREPGRKGKVVIGYAGFARHCGVYPHSGGIIPQMAADLTGWKTSKSGVLFTPDRPLPDGILRRIIALRLKEIAGG